MRAVARDFAAARNLLPVASPWKLNYALSKDALSLYAAAPALASAHPTEASFFPDKPGIIKGAAAQKMSFTKDGLVLKLAAGDKASAMTGALSRGAGAEILRWVDPSPDGGCAQGRGA